MSEYCIYAEKYDIGVKIAAALSGGFNAGNKKITLANIESIKDSLTDIKTNGYISIGGIDVTWGMGHMCALFQAKDYNNDYKNWSKMPQPFVPDKYNIKVRDGVDYKTGKSTGEADKNVVKQLKVIQKLFNSAKTIVCATDDDREGELIFAYVRRILKCNKDYMRMKLSSLTENGIKTAFNNLLPSSAVIGIKHAGECRAIADWVVGANLTAAASVHFKNDTTLPMITLGRVQTVVLDFIVEREKKIKNFVSEPTYSMMAEFDTGTDKYIGKHVDSPMKDKNKCKDIYSKIAGKKGIVTKLETKKVKKEVPLLYNLATLQRAANEVYGFTADKTLQYAQSLYEKGFISYPRTESECLTDDMIPEVEKVLAMLETYDPRYKKWIDSVVKRNYTKRHFDTSKVESHYAIIPTDQKPNNLTDEESKIYDLLAKSLIRIIYDSALLEKTNVETTVNGEIFKSNGSIIIDKQWMAVSDGKTTDTILPSLAENQVVDGRYGVKEGKTEPPKRYTDATLLAAMQTASKEIDDEKLKKMLQVKNKGGIGRPSTQANIIKTVVERYCHRSGKSIIPNDEAIKMMDLIQITELKSPEMTALWESRLDDVEKNKLSKDKFIADIEEKTREWTKTILDTPATKTSSSNTVGCNCPKCGKPLNKYQWGIGCTGYKDNSCNFSLSTKMYNGNVSIEELEYLLKHGKTSRVLNFVSKNNKKYKAYVLLNNGETSLEFAKTRKK